ncbi:putative transcription factor E4F1 [Scophthalmus maximus]|uniref:Transcription factor E4F1 n=1 Tax=Scophthalmus maximus TaxID=52904 RepID=A0A2U9CSR1_SCOMX|nr:transcription factor E4F1 [Scophthalmus maximus]AWP18869.1 putative transcription factor E4F1 [Scophthalmus maximus]
MNVENNHTAETERERSKNGTETITIHTTLGDEDEDVHRCGRCQTEFSSLEAFIQHKLQHSCKREEGSRGDDDDDQQVTAAHDTAPAEVKAAEGESSDEPGKTTNDEGGGQLGRGRRRKTASLKVTDQSDGTEESISDNADSDKPPYKVNRDGRYICQLCEKTFKTTNILRTHMKTHSDQKNFSCDLCGTSFRTKGSLIRHNRRHTDERPYRCTLCGQSFRESGALTRHLKALTPCTEKIRFVQYKEILVSKDGIQKGVEADHTAVTGEQEVVVVEQQPEEQEIVEAQTAVVSVVEAGSQEVLHQVHFTMEVDGTTQEQQVVVEQSQAEALAAAAAAGDNLICQAIINSGIALETEETVVEETTQETEEMDKVVSDCPDVDENIEEIHVKEEFVEMETEETEDGGGRTSKLHTCPHCNRSFKGLNYFRFHVKGHLGYKPFKCTLCHKEFLTGYLLKKHMEVHVSERRYKCGECGKLYKTVGHVREHMRAHSDERPYHCGRCSKGYKTKNALQVHQRTHGDDKPYVCQFCLRGFREKGSLVRHIRHHTGEKPFKCPKCGRGFAEHGTLNRHMRAKGGCQKDDSSESQVEVTEEQASVDSLATAAIISEDPHAVLVEFSSVVADTQEYIIKTQTDEEVQEEEVTLIQDGQNEMGNHIMKVVQRLVSQSRGAGGTGSHQIIVRNVEVDEEGPSISDCGDTITIATPESLTEQVAMTLASAISDGTLLATTGTVETADGTVTMVTAEEAVEEGIEVLQQQEEYVITTPEEVEIQTVIV